MNKSSIDLVPLRSDYTKKSLQTVKNLQSKYTDQNKITFDEELLIVSSSKLIKELKKIYDAISKYYKNKKKRNHHIVYRCQSWYFSESYKIFYGSPTDFIQTIIDIYLFFEFDKPSYSLEIYHPFGDNFTINLPNNLLHMISFHQTQFSVLIINLFPSKKETAHSSYYE